MGKIFVTQGKLRENTGNFILARTWPPCMNDIVSFYAGLSGEDTQTLPAIIQ